MFQKAVHSFILSKFYSGDSKTKSKTFALERVPIHFVLILMAIVALVGCSKVSGGEIEIEEAPENPILYENPDFGIRIFEVDGWVIEKETAQSVEFKNEKIIAIISVIPKGDTVAEIKQGLISAAGSVTVTGEGPNFISYKSDRNESIHTNVFIEEKRERNIITTFLTPFNDYESNREEIEAFRWNTETY